MCLVVVDGEERKHGWWWCRFVGLVAGDVVKGPVVTPDHAVKDPFATLNVAKGSFSASAMSRKRPSRHEMIHSPHG